MRFILHISFNILRVLILRELHNLTQICKFNVISMEDLDDIL